ncbi:mitochondrial carrier domain-containing protein [Schizophyllum fasciatum]
MATTTTAAAAAAASPSSPPSPSTPTSHTAPKRDKPAHSLFAGATAGAVEAFLTYPTEFVKTRAQLGGPRAASLGGPPGGPPGPPREAPLAILRSTLRERGARGLYAGCGALVVGNAAKAGVRFLTYDHLKALLADAEGRVSAPRSLLAGLGAGMAEAVLAVTPSETIKTKLIDDAKRARPQYRGLAHGTLAIVRAEGLRGVYRGLVPVMARQGANSAVRFTTYTTLKQFVQSTARPGQQLPSTITFGIGAVAGLVTVYSTMPLDVIKTRMQALDARAQYRGVLHCAYRIATEEGVRRFWTGTGPRLVRLVFSGGIVFTVYENVMRLVA